MEKVAVPSFLRGRKRCPFCDDFTEDVGEEGLQVHCLWKHSLDYITRKRRLAALSGQPPKTNEPQPLANRLKKLQRSKERLEMLQDRRPPNRTCPHQLKPCKDFPLCHERRCGFAHPRCPLDVCIRDWCRFDHGRRKKACQDCLRPSDIPKRFASDALIRCPHRKFWKCKFYPKCPKKQNCNYLHLQCCKSGCDREKCIEDHVGVVYFCSDCESLTNNWRRSFE